jgi:hypothetical protein
VVLLACGAGCGSRALPDPREAIAAYAAAAKKGDYQTIYGMLSERSRKTRTLDDIRRVVADEREELALQATALADRATVARASARLRFADGEDALLDLEGDGFRISAADGLPEGARSPEQALEQLRRVLALRIYAGLMRVLSPATRGTMEGDLRALVEGLARPDGLEVQVSGDTASVQVRGGHSVKLRREGGIWRVEDFD